MRLLSILFVILVFALAFAPNTEAACRSGGIRSRISARIAHRQASRHAQTTTTMTRTTVAVKGGGCANGKCAK